MTGASEGMIACPFPPCTARIRPVTHRIDPHDASRIAKVVPIHDVEGPGSWFGRCPASQFEVPELSAAARTQLASSLRAYSAQLADRIRGRRWNPRGPWDAHRGDLGAEASASPEHHRTPPSSRSDYFPPRPAETGDASTQQRGAGMTTRDDLRAMVLAAQRMGADAQETCALITEKIEDISMLIGDLAEKQQTGAAMSVAAIGADATAPMPAREAVAMFSRLGELIIEQRATLALLNMRNDSAHRVAGRAATASASYGLRI